MPHGRGAGWGVQNRPSLCTCMNSCLICRCENGIVSGKTYISCFLLHTGYNFISAEEAIAAAAFVDLDLLRGPSIRGRFPSGLHWSKKKTLPI